MTDSYQAAQAALDAALASERAIAASALAEAEASIDSLIQQANALRGMIADLNAKLAALNPWASIDNTGATDVTAAVQKALDAGLTVPAGRYLIDPVKGLTVTHNVTMDPAAVLVAKPNSAPRYCVLTLAGDDLVLTGGQIIGDRLSHTYTTGSTHEWGYGLMVKGNRCTVDGLKVSQCTGDGIGVAGSNHTIKNVVSTQNRRQGMSVFTAPGLKVYDSEFSATGGYLTDPAAPYGPCAGIDIEPDVASTVDVWLERCTLTGNRAGVLAWLRAEVGGNLMVNVVDCVITDNANGVQGKALAGKVSMVVRDSTLTRNRGSAVRAEAGASIAVGTSNADDANRITGMVTRKAFDLTGTDTRTKYDLLAVTPGVIVAGLNHYL